MRLTRYSDYAIRVMVHLGHQDGKLCSIAEIAQRYDISRSHLMKIVQDLGSSGFVETVRGRSGGLRLARPAEQISLGALIRHTEGDLNLVDCTGCLIAPACGLPPILAEAMRAFFDVLDRYTLADLMSRKGELRLFFALEDQYSPKQERPDSDMLRGSAEQDPTDSGL